YSRTRSGKKSGREGAMLRGFGAHCAFALAAGLLAGTCEIQAAGNDANICIKESGDAAIDACSRAIQSKRFSGHVLARQYLSRGVERRAKEDYESALADFAEAAKIDKKYADAFYNRCAIYNFRKEYDATIAGGSERLGKDNALSDYYAERGFAYFRKDDHVHALVDLDNAIRLNEHNGRALK